MSEILTAKENSIFTITLNRPEKRNALNDALINNLKDALREADKDENLKAILIKGAGQAIFVRARICRRCRKLPKAM